MYRRNGKPTSCEPCRLSKVRCDHATPICARCRARRITEKCYYHPAPMTRSGTKYRHFHKGTPSDAGHSRSASLDSHDKAPFTVLQPVLQRAQEDHNGDQPLNLVLPDSSPVPPPGSSRLAFAKHHFMSLCASYSKYRKLISHYCDHSRFFVIPRPLILKPFVALQDDLEEGANLYSYLAQNACKALPTISVNTSVEDFCGCLNGSGLRWEFVGLIFALAGLASVNSEAEKPFDNETFGADMYTASRICIEICEENNQLNDITIWLRHTHVSLTSNLFGDTSNALYRTFSSLTADLFAMGYHRQISSQFGVPFFMSEARKRIFAAAVCRDMGLATLLERPPFIDCNFCDITYPLDVDEEEILLVGSELDAALQKLNGNGWRIVHERERLLRPATGVRLRYLSSNLRAKVLRLSLGNRMECMTEKCLELYQEYKDNWAEVPLQYRYESTCWDHMSPTSCVLLLATHLDYLYCGFQIQRIHQQEGQGTTVALLDTSVQLLSGMLDFIKQQERFVELRGHYGWIFLFYGLPGAGTLAAELHKHTIEGIPLPPSIPCSRIVRDLSVAISWFENRGLPTHPDYQLCVQICTVISRLLDDTLNQGLVPLQDTATRRVEGQEKKRALEGLNMNGDSNLSDNVPSYSEPFTSEDFLSWVDDLVWDGHVSMEF